MLRFSIRDCFLATLLIAVLTAWGVDRTRLASKIARPFAEQESLRQDVQRLRSEIRKQPGYANWIGGP